MSARLTLNAPKPMSESLSRLLEKTKAHVVTPEEREAQRRSWVVGELMLQYPKMTREAANALYDKCR